MASEAWEDGEVVPVAADNSGEALIHRCALECGIPIAAAVATQEFWDEHLPARTGMDGGGTLTRKQFMDTLADVLAKLISYQDRQPDNAKLLRMPARALALALGMPLVAGAESPTELARRLGLEALLGNSGKATTHKCHAHFIAAFNLPNLPTQRTESARNNMTKARKKQLHAKQH